MLPKESSKAIRSILSLRANLPTRRSTALRTQNSFAAAAANAIITTQTSFQRSQRSFSIYSSSYTSLPHNIIHHSSSYIPLSTTTAAATHHHKTPSSSLSSSSSSSRRTFHTEAAYTKCANETLEEIQDSLDDILEDYLDSPHCKLNPDQVELNYASGVFTIAFPPIGTWVLNLQTPNQQIWWSSPHSGPRRYEWDEKEHQWVWTKYVDYVEGGGERSEWKETIGLKDALREELLELLGVELP